MKQGKEPPKSCLSVSATSWPSRPRKTVCVNSRWMSKWNARWIDKQRINRQQLSLKARWLHSRGRSRPLWKLRWKKKPLDSATMSSEQTKKTRPATWRTWSWLRSSRQPNSVSSTSWIVRIALANNFKKSLIARPMIRPSTKLTCKEWSVKSSNLSIDWRIQSCWRKLHTMN